MIKMQVFSLEFIVETLCGCDHFGLDEYVGLCFNLGIKLINNIFYNIVNFVLLLNLPPSKSKAY